MWSAIAVLMSWKKDLELKQYTIWKNLQDPSLCIDPLKVRKYILNW